MCQVCWKSWFGGFYRWCFIYEFRRQLGDKAERYGSKLIIADRFYPSSQLCSNCGYRQKMPPLVRRTFECPNCGLKIDRDLNASRNLEKSPGSDDYTCGRGCCRQSRTKQEININIRLCPVLFKFYRAEFNLWYRHKRSNPARSPLRFR